MKKLIMFLIPVFAITIFSSCSDNEVATDDLLIEEIANAENKIAVEVKDLPQASQQLLTTAYFDTYAEVSYRVEGKGYGLEMGTGEGQYFNLAGEILTPGRRGKGPRSGHDPNICNINVIDISELSEEIKSYIAENYPDAEIKGARVRGEYIVVGLTGHVILIFNTNSEFIEEAEIVPHHGHGAPIAIEDLSIAITDYITANYATAAIKKAFEVRDGKVVVGLLIDDARVILVFDADGNFLFERE